MEGTGQSGVNDTIKKLKEQAAKLGANGVLMGKMGQRYAGSFGSSSYLGWGNFLGSSTATYSQTIEAQAIYVPQPGEAAAGTYDAPENGAWPLQLPQFDVNASCQLVGGNVAQCVSAEQAARAWLAHHTAPVQIAGDCSNFAQATQSYTMIEACVQQRERAAKQ